MQYDDEDLSVPEKEERKCRRTNVVLGFTVLAGVLLFAYYKPLEESEPERGNQLEEGWYEEVLSHLPPEPEETEIEEEQTISAPEIGELPTLNNSDAAMQERIASLSSKHQLLPWLQSEYIIRRAVAITNGLGDGIILGKLLNVPPPKGQFRAAKSGEQYWISKNNYQRYEYLVNVITALDSNSLITTYRAFYPLMQEAYGELGLPDSDMNTSVIAAINQILSAPRLETPVELKLDSVTYTFADPELEALPPIQKLLVRMGPENTLKIQRKVMEIRSKLLSNKKILGK